MKTLYISLLLLIDFCSFAQTTPISFEYYERLMFVNVRVNQKDSLLFLIDTGANASAIDSKTVEEISLTTHKIDTVEGSVGAIVVPFVTFDSLIVGNQSINGISASCYDLSGSLAPPGKKINGILGTDFMKHFVMEIDFNNALILFSKTIQDTLSISFPFHLDNEIPCVEVLFEHQIKTKLRYDSGSSIFETKDTYLNITSQIFEMLEKRDATLRPVTYLSATGIGGTVTTPVYQINSVLFDIFELTNPFIIVQPKQGYFGRPDAVGFFGNNLFEKFEKVTIDFINKRIYLKNK